MKIRISHVEEKSYVDGPGFRTVLFVQGCPIHCMGCQNIDLWSPNFGELVDVNKVAINLSKIARNHQVTISGGEPFAQAVALSVLVSSLKEEFHHHIIIYTGYTWEWLISPNNPMHNEIKVILDHTNILVDGPFIQSMDDNTIIYRGSRNQRAIDVPKSLQTGTTIIKDWYDPEVVIADDGTIYLPIGFSQMGEEIGEVRDTRMCGQTK